jgi:DNA-directed RNA polymerase beta' subunit
MDLHLLKYHLQADGVAGAVERIILQHAQVVELFKRITDEDCELLWMTAGVGRPENLIVQNLLVPPVPIRPSVPMENGGGSTEVCARALVICMCTFARKFLTMRCRVKR